NSVCSIVTEVVLHCRRKATRANRCNDSRDPTSHVREFETSGVLSLCTEGVCRARPCPIRSTVIREEQSLLCACGYVITIIGIYSDFPDGVVLGELSRWFAVSGAKHVRAKHCPGCATVDRLENALTSHRK